MGYDPYSAVNAIYKLKGQWDNANKAGNTERKNDIATKAQEYYKQLRSNGYNDIADQLSASNYTQAKSINDKWATMGKTKTRDYLYSLGKSKGMSQSDVDKLIDWDNLTGEVSFGGKKIGTPDAVVDGVSYWSDTSVLDDAFNDYINRSGTVRSKSIAVDQENEKLFSKYNQEYEDLKNTNPFETETGKAILAKYDLAGLQGRDNQVASGASSNGGNIDSFAAANALRQQSSLINQGQMVALDAHQQKLDHARALLSDMGVNIDRVFNQDETAKNNEVARLSEQASVTGYVPNEWIIKNDDTYNMFLNEDGTFKKEKESVDIQALIDQAKANGDTETANKLAVVRARKILGNYSEFGKYSNMGDISFVKPQQTEVGRQFDKQNETALKTLGAETDLAKYEIDTNKSIATGNNTTDLAIANLKNTTPDYDLADIERMLKNTKTPSQELIDVYNAISGDATTYTVDNPPPITGKNVDDETPNTIDLDADSSTNGTTNESKDIYSKWEKSGIVFTTVNIGQLDESKLKSVDVDKHGKKAIKDAISAVTNSTIGVEGVVSNYDLADYLIRQSDINNTNKDQLGKVFAYFGLDKNMLKKVEDAGFWFWESGKGTNYK